MNLKTGKKLSTESVPKLICFEQNGFYFENYWKDLEKIVDCVMFLFFCKNKQKKTLK